ncbi:PLDc N-terminal domain-containing protein [Microbacteriaceae bacterium VKM Ac-2854]|nr:PLDc N-terminal domain-containing protein [Microbacteriaceae bacterium VKM Ac-2854]
MIRLFIGLLVAVAVFTVYTVVDCAMSNRLGIRGVPKWAWLLMIILLPLIGAGLWFAIGRPRKNRETVRRSTAPDDDLEFLGKIGRDREQEERIARLERELAELDDPGEADGSGRRDA